MMTAKPRTDEPLINIETRSGSATRNVKADGKKVVEDTWVRNTTEKASMFNIHKEKEVYIEVKLYGHKSFNI